MSINNIVDVGTPSYDISEDWSTTVVRFHGFANLTSTRNAYVESPIFTCSGYQWEISLYPGGTSHSLEGNVAFGLKNKSNTSVKIQYGFSIRDADGKEVVHEESQTDEFYAAYGSVFFPNHAKRAKLMKSLVNGSLDIEIRMKSTSTDKSITQFIPTNPINKNVLELFNEEETADIIFEVGEQQTKGKRKRAKTATTNFYAHRIILQKCTPALYEMCGRSDGEGITTVTITDVKPEIFKHMIYYAYGGKLSDEDLNNNAKDIIDACDKYGVVHLKLEAEACYVKSNELTLDNIVDNLLYADSMNLALLKEAVMDFLLANKRDVIGKISFDIVPGGLMTDLLTAVARAEESVEGDSTDYNKMRVGELRKMLNEKGLDVDGSRETMIALLKEHSA